MISKLFVFISILLTISAQVCPNGRARIESAGTDDGNYIKILFPDLTVVIDQVGGNDPMGLWVYVISGTSAQSNFFKLATNGLGSESENNVLKTFVDSLPANTQVLVGTKGGAQWLNQVGMDALKQLGATQWSVLNTPRISFAMIGKKGTSNAALQQFKLAKQGISVVEGCITSNAPTCTAGQYYDATSNSCKACDASCKACYDTPKKCSLCNANYEFVSTGLCSPSGGVVSCPTGTIKLNSLCISESCIPEIEALKSVTGKCTEETNPRKYNSTLTMVNFPMKQSCQYTTAVSQETKDNKYVAVKDYIVKYEDKGAELSFVNVFTDAVNMCPSAKVGDEITYTCTFNVTISMAKVPQTTIWFKQTLIVKTDTQASLKSVNIEQNKIDACTGDQCKYYISVASDVKQCKSFTDCTGEAPTNTNFKRNDKIIVRQFISDIDFKTWFLIPRMVRLTSPVTDVEIKATGGYKFNNNVAGEIIYEITLAFATGGIVSLDVTSIISQSKSLLRALQTTNKEKAVVTSQQINLNEPTTEKTTTDPPDDKWKDIVIGCVVGIGGAIIIGIVIFCIWKKSKGNQQQQKTQEKYADNEPAKAIEMNHQKQEEIN